MKRIGTAAAYAFYLEFALGCVTMLTLAPCPSGNAKGLIGVLFGLIWDLHALGYGLASMLTNSNAAFWGVMLGTCYLQWTFIFWLIMYLRDRKAEKVKASGTLG